MLEKVLNKMKIGDKRKIWMTDIRRESPIRRLKLAMNPTGEEAKKRMLHYGGHAVMIYKAEEDKFNFFDPNTGFLEGLTAHQTSITFTHSFNSSNQTLEGKLSNIAFLDNEKILDKFNKRENRLIYKNRLTDEYDKKFRTLMENVSIYGGFEHLWRI